MDTDFQAVAALLGQPVIAIQVALPLSVKGKWPWPGKVRTNLAAIRTGGGTLLFARRMVANDILDGTHDDSPWHDGEYPYGCLTVVAAGDDQTERAALASLVEPSEWVDLASLLAEEPGRICIPGATACEVRYSLMVRGSASIFDAHSIHIYSIERTTTLEPGTNGVIECS